MEERRGAWGRLLALFRLVHGGDGTGWIRSRGGKLFDPGAFPFLEGRDNGDDRPAPPHVTDGCVLRVLDGLLVLGGEKLSYRTLDVQHIGSVYETVMGFTVLAMPGPALAIKAGKNNRTPVFVDLAALAGKHGKEREKFLKDEADRSGQLAARVAAALAAAPDAAALAEALRPIVDERGSPHGPVPSGTPLLQPTDERRRTGSHYTPRSLTEPIVRHALEPTFARLGPEARPEQVLALKVCDPAMGSGAFLVEACRQLAARLVAAWTKHAGTRPPVAEDEDEDLRARRLVAQRCLYGVDRNPIATDLARLSLWLATLARDHEFTFLDHALKSGDSLVGLTRNQIGALTWGDDRQDSAMSGFVRGRVAEAVRARAEIRDAPDDVERAIQEARHRALEVRMDDVRALGDAVLACFFGHNKPRAREAGRQTLAARPGDEAMWDEARRLAAALGVSVYPIRPFHWEVEFPEVFERTEGGFDAIVGNPPFLGVTGLGAIKGGIYASYLRTQFPDTRGKSDIVAFFFRKAFSLLRNDGALGLVATKTICQGDTRNSGLREIVRRGGSIFHVSERFRWPGDAEVVTSAIHVRNGASILHVLRAKVVSHISSFLWETSNEDDPARLARNAGGAQLGAKVQATPFSLTISDPVCRQYSKAILRPIVGADEVFNRPYPTPERLVFDLRGLTANTFRLKLPSEAAYFARACGLHGAQDLTDQHLRWSHSAGALYERIKSNKHVLVTPSSAAMYFAIAKLPNEMIFSHKLVIFASESNGDFAILQSRLHEIWAAEFSTSFGSSDALTYNPTQIFATFPFRGVQSADLGSVGGSYLALRQEVMGQSGVGLTRTYNRLHNLSDRAADIQRLRDLHHGLDVAVLRAYGWEDFAARAVPEFLTEATEPDQRYQGRLFWPAPFRDEVLARLLDLNRARAAEERALGLSPGKPDDSEEDQNEAA